MQVVPVWVHLLSAISNPIDDMGIRDQGLKTVIQKVEAFEHRMYSHPLHNDPNLETVYTLCGKKSTDCNRH
ncbi:hypothetical protein Celaphus_00005670 [Cervus elaphus hippelaphus]|uniref:Exosome RNA helicase MTR4-like beta-barrel domain-containing protein n=1 Tax=Cervus elaphus hippelaphus TaxID=46360 RepID=A0A212CXT2_CEREH|nr:hypothetical protein Celaphus_00005670 [Cervus elaphus hippelaphus]